MVGQRTVEIPQSVLVSARSLDDLEDWLAAHDPEFLKEMLQIRNEEDLAGGGKDLEEIIGNRSLKVYRVQHRSEVYRRL